MKRTEVSKRNLAFAAILLILSLVFTGCSTSSGGGKKDAETTVLSSGETQDTDTSNTSGIESGGESNDSESTPPETEAVNPWLQKIKDPSEIKFRFTQAEVAKLKASLYPDFNKVSSESVIVPALKEYFVPQGMDYWPELDWLMISGYFSKNEYSSCSAIVAVELSSGRFMGEYLLKNIDGSDHASHVGGVAVTEKNLYVSNGKTLYRIPLESIIDAEQSGYVKIVEEITVPVNGSYCNYSEGILWVGEFQYSTSYITDSSHHMKNRSGKEYKAWTVGYVLTSETENEFKPSALGGSFAIPDYVLSMTERIQGMTVIGDSIILSQSYGRTNDSTIFIYNNPLEEPPHKTITLGGVSVPLWFLDDKTGVRTLKAPPMSEGVCNVDGKLFILFESGADKYMNDGGKNPTDRVWITDITKLK